MLATLTDRTFDDPAWLFEPKWDGIRALAVCDESTQLLSRRGNDVTVGYPELSNLHSRLVALDAIVDGEIVAFDDGKPSFQKLQRRMHVRNEQQLSTLVRTSPVVFMAFDLIYLDGASLIGEPLEVRRRLLEEIVVPDDKIQVSPATLGEGTVLYEAAVTQGLEGIVAKRIDSRYEPGKRSPAWLKIKTVLDLDAVVVGWSEGSGSRARDPRLSGTGALRRGRKSPAYRKCRNRFQSGLAGRRSRSSPETAKRQESFRCRHIEEQPRTSESALGAPRLSWRPLNIAS